MVQSRTARLAAEPEYTTTRRLMAPPQIIATRITGKKLYVLTLALPVVVSSKDLGERLGAGAFSTGRQDASVGEDYCRSFEPKATVSRLPQYPATLNGSIRHGPLH